MGKTSHCMVESFVQYFMSDNVLSRFYLNMTECGMIVVTYILVTSDLLLQMMGFRSIYEALST